MMGPEDYDTEYRDFDDDEIDYDSLSDDDIFSILEEL